MNIAEYSSTADDIALDLAKKLAANINNPEMKAFLKKEVNTQFDGDFNFLFLNAANKPIGNAQSTTFLNLLYNKGSNNARINNNDLINQIENEYPLLQIAIPKLVGASPETWDTESYTPLIAVVPTNYTEASGDNHILAFDAEGNEHYVDTKNEPDNLVIIISANERIQGFLKTTNARFDLPCFEMYATPALETNNWVFYLKDDVSLYRFDDGCEPPGDDDPPGDDNPPPTGCGCDRDCKTTQEKLFKLKFRSIDKLRSVEDWIQGKVELVIFMVYTTQSTAAYFEKNYREKRKEFRTCRLWGNCQPIWKNFNMTYTEFKTEYGDKIIVAMAEEDNVWPISVTETHEVFVSSTIDGRLVTKSVGIPLSSNGYEYMGNVEIDYCEKANSPGKLYSNNFVDFYWGQN